MPSLPSAALLTALLGTQAAGAVVPGGDIAVLSQRLREDLLGEPRHEEAAQAEGYRTALRPDGTWPDIDFKDQTRSAWKAREHLSRLEVMARVEARTPSPELRVAIAGAYDHWVGKDYRNPNWWHNEIGVPMLLSDTMLFVSSELEGARRQRGLDIVKRAKVGMTGQNLLWKAGIQCIWSCLEGDEAHLAEALAAITKEIRITGEEGVQADYSFHQHGKVLYNGGYGAGFALDSARWAWLVDGTRFAFPPEKRAVVLHYLLDGQRWMVRGATFDYAAIGREISRKGHSAHSLAGACGYLLRLQGLSPEERTALGDMVARIHAGAGTGATGATGANKAPAPPLEGDRAYPRSDYLVHQRAAWAMTVHMVSQRLVNTDMPANDEGLRSQAIADGATFLYRSGDEYRDIFGVWDWVRIPGTTEVSDPALFKTPVRFTGPTGFVGALSDGRYGAAVMDFQRDKGRLKAGKAWFLFDDEAVCLGAGLSSAADKPLVTTLNQCLLHGEVQAETITQGVLALPQGERLQEGVRWVLHDGIGYVFPQTVAVHIANRPQEGSWWEINHAASKTPERREVFSLWLDHGTLVSGKSYAYILVPGTDAQRLKDGREHLPISILANTTELQAVWHSQLGMVQAAFWKPGTLPLPLSVPPTVPAEGPLAITVDHPCLVLAQQQPKGLHLAVADPAQTLPQLTLSLPGRYIGAGCTWREERKATDLTVTLPGAERAGSTVVLDVAR